MAIEIEDYINVRNRAAELGCIIPERIAILPTNFESAKSRSDFLLQFEAATVKTLFRENGIAIDPLLPKDERCSYIQNNALEWIGPALFISAALYSENENAISVALGVLSSYVTDFFKGRAGKNAVKLEIVIEKKGNHSCKKLTYEGDVSGLSDIPAAIKGIANE